MARKRSAPTHVPQPEKARPKQKLTIEVVWSDIQAVEADVLLVGHYLGVLPQTAERKLDELVSGTDGAAGEKLIITELTRRAALRGDLGEVVFFPAPNGRVVALGGMGSVGTFRAAQVRILARAIGQVVGLLPGRQTLATVLIGSGKGNLRIREAVAPFLEGLAEALEGDEKQKLDCLKIVERDLDRALEILACVVEYATLFNGEHKDQRVILESHPALQGKGGRISEDFGCAMMLAALAQANRMTPPADLHSALGTVLAQLPNKALQEEVRKRLSKAYPKDAEKKAFSLSDLAMKFRLREPDADDTAAENASRVAFWRSDNDVLAAAITNTTTVTQRAIPNRAPLVEQGLERLQNPDADSLTKRAASLYRLLVPRELKKDVLERTEPLVIEVDPTLARVQWEALPAGPDARPLGLARPVARQLRTFYSPRPFQPGTRPGLKALVIGDPGGPGIVLEEARKEAVEVEKVLKKNGVDTQLLIGAPEDGTGAGVLPNVSPADYLEIVDLLLSGEFDIVHYSGHATPDRTGWVFKAGVLTAQELEGMERPPRLVVANACLSSKISRGDSRLVATLADEFFKQGVSDYIGAAWEIRSVPARVFAEEFYTALLTPPGKIGSAMLKARAALYKRKDLGTAWAAYQHYGDPTRSILSGFVQKP